jgi:DNA mismatch endonuclease (patch repair protein)
MSPETRSAVMSRIQARNTGPERALAAEMARLGLVWEAQARDLSGRPDFVFRDRMVAVFVDGDFWHGWRFPAWRNRLSRRWEDKIAANRARDFRNHRRLRRLGWRVVRLWEHQIERGPGTCARKVQAAISSSSRSWPPPTRYRTDN